MTSFQEMGLPDVILRALEQMNFTTPTPIQQQAIPLALAGQDILGSAQTGTGKTGAFGIPLIAKLLSNPKSVAVVMTPTRELATQVASQLNAMLGRNSAIKSALLIGGEPMPRQLQQLRQRPRIIVGTPGRVNDHLQRGSLKLRDADFLVLDETDRMLDMDFSIQIEGIIASMSPNRQTLLFSATVPQNIVRISEQYLKNPAHISVNSPSSPVAKITQKVVHTTVAHKYSNLLDEISDRTGSIILFVNTKLGTERMAKKLSTEGYETCAIHGDLRQQKRDRVIAGFRQKKYRILVATDVAARGLDIPHIAHVINYDLPQCAEDYIHRIGRTGRAGAEGAALSFLSPSDKYKWKAIERLLNPNASDTYTPPRPKKHKARADGGTRFTNMRSQDNDRFERTKSSDHASHHRSRTEHTGEVSHHRSDTGNREISHVRKDFSYKSHGDNNLRKQRGEVRTSRTFGTNDGNTTDTGFSRNHTDRNFADNRSNSNYADRNSTDNRSNSNYADRNSTDNRSPRTNHFGHHTDNDSRFGERRPTSNRKSESIRNNRTHTTHTERTDYDADRAAFGDNRLSNRTNAGRTSSRHADSGDRSSRSHHDGSTSGRPSNSTRSSDSRNHTDRGFGDNNRTSAGRDYSVRTDHAGRTDRANHADHHRTDRANNAGRSDRNLSGSRTENSHNDTRRHDFETPRKRNEGEKFSYADTGVLKKKPIA